MPYCCGACAARVSPNKILTNRIEYRFPFIHSLMLLFYFYLDSYNFINSTRLFLALFSAVVFDERGSNSPLPSV